ncbi:ASCH domain-containing protein [Virgibacillus soli]|uniref:ASCH domain-containing protein n=1 Tax=Paracerasibacillus soli TaxID=480284 RepID=A0ABU5CXJ2_9BACI|nr:ASCH domain-containing protein [Virgibacillus soli]MDY0410170.1 ASCH domain-containing protein [Virgibacillus soli]
MYHESVVAMWEAYKKVNPNAPEFEKFDVWAFGSSKEGADELAALVLEGIKTATASNYALFELQGEQVPYPGLYNIILNGDGKAVAIIETTSVEIVPFHEVSADFAYLEGEGDRSLQYWRDVHEEFFANEWKAIGQEFDENMLVVCEGFKVVYK